MKGDQTTKTQIIEKLVYSDQTRIQNPAGAKTEDKDNSSEESLSLRHKQAQSVKVDISELNIVENSSPKITADGSPPAS